MTTPREVLSIEEYTCEVVALVDGPVASETVDTASAAGRVLAQDARSMRQQVSPGFRPLSVMRRKPVTAKLVPRA